MTRRGFSATVSEERGKQAPSCDSLNGMGFQENNK